MPGLTDREIEDMLEADLAEHFTQAQRQALSRAVAKVMMLNNTRFMIELTAIKDDLTAHRHP